MSTTLVVVLAMLIATPLWLIWWALTIRFIFRGGDR